MKLEFGRAALISVYDKTGIEDFARQLRDWEWDILASGGTAKYLTEHGVPVHDVADLVGGGPILGHRVVTLSREIHAGLLARNSLEDQTDLQRLGIPRIGLVCVDLYPLETAITAEEATDESVRETTDIGGPALLRAAAKGRRIVICRPEQRERVLRWIDVGQPERERFLDQLVAEAELLCAEYALTSARYWSRHQINGVTSRRSANLKYGENPWQQPAELHATQTNDPLALPKFNQLCGSPLGYCNYTDLDRALNTLTLCAAALDKPGFDRQKIAIGVKHGNPCGAGYGSTASQATKRMLTGNLIAIFGGSVIVNYKLTLPRAYALFSHMMPEGSFRRLDLVVTPAITESALQFVSQRGCRVLVNDSLGDLSSTFGLDRDWRYRQVRGGLLLQPAPNLVLNLQDPEIELYGDRLSELESDLLLAWAIGSTSVSNTVCLVKNGQLIGNGCGQQDRVTACRHAVEKAIEAGHETTGAVAYSDSFFPFVDGPAVLAGAKVRAVLTCSGSVRDREVMRFFQANGITVYAVPHTIGRGFFGH
ncbi:hypothetical protein KKF05_01230 [Patescibacteria group bacterium]|nr:hypothetical protein [Patescibacteria group bacterium]